MTEARWHRLSEGELKSAIRNKLAMAVFLVIAIIFFVWIPNSEWLSLFDLDQSQGLNLLILRSCMTLLSGIFIGSEVKQVRVFYKVLRTVYSKNITGEKEHNSSMLDTRSDLRENDQARIRRVLNCGMRIIKAGSGYSAAIVGCSGTGKTFGVKAWAESCGLSVVALSSPNEFYPNGFCDLPNVKEYTTGGFHTPVDPDILHQALSAVEPGGVLVVDEAHHFIPQFRHIRASIPHNSAVIFLSQVFFPESGAEEVVHIGQIEAPCSTTDRLIVDYRRG